MSDKEHPEEPQQDHDEPSQVDESLDRDGEEREASEDASTQPVNLRRRLTSFTTSRPVAVLMVFLAAIAFGALSYGRLPVTLMPELSYPTLTVRTEYPGAAPEEVENDISRPIEESLGVVSGLERISSISRADVSDVVLEFAWDVEMAEAIQDTLEKLDLVFLPPEAERPLILRFDPQLDPVLELSMSGDGDLFEGEDGLRRLRRIAELQVKRSLEPVKGVAAVRVRGGLEEEIHVLVDEEALRRTGLSIQRVIERLAQENINVAGGTIKEGRTEYMVRTLNEYTDLTEIADTVITVNAGREVRLRDLAQVGMAHKERQIATRTDGRESVQIDVYKEADANMVSLADRVRAEIGEFDKEAFLARQENPEAAEEGRGRRGGGRGEGRGGGGPGGGGGPSGLAEQLYATEGVEIAVVADRSEFIESSIAEVRNTAVIGGFLAVIVLFLFLANVRSTFIIAVSIPISLVVTFAPLNLAGVSLNIMSLGGLALGIGMLVDSSIVVLESIFRCREEGDDIETAAVRGTREVRGAVIASTLTSIAVFFPMVFVEGVAGQAFGDLGLAVVISLLVSLVVAVAFIPMLASRQAPDLDELGAQLKLRAPALFGQFRDDVQGIFGWWRERGLIGKILLVWVLPLGLLYLVVRFVLGLVLALVGVVPLLLLYGLFWLSRWLFIPVTKLVFGVLMAVPSWITEKVLGVLQGVYPRVLRWSLANPLVMILLAGVTFYATYAIGSNLDSELLPEVHQGEVTFEIALPVGTPLEETEAVIDPIAEAILAEREHIEKLLVTVGYDPENAQRSDEGEHTAKFKVLLDSARPDTEAAVVDRIRERLAAIPDLDARVTRPVLFSFRTPVEVEIHGEDLDQLKEWADRIEAEMASLSSLADVETTLRAGAPEVQIVYDRDRLARYELNVQTVAAQVRDAVLGNEATRYNLRDRRIPILVRFQEEDRATVEDVRDLLVNPGTEDRPIPLSAVAAVELGEGPSEVRRIDGRRVALVRANLSENAALGNAVTEIESSLGGLDWPDDMAWFITGQNQEWERSQGSLWLALALSIFLVYVIMAAQFESLVYPFVIMFTIPLAFFGTVVALWWLGISLSIVVFLGMIMLAGIVVNNAIVLVDYINQLKARGLSRQDAVVTAGSIRLRPILMTTATTVLGLLPMALGIGDGAEIRTPMALAVISGLIASTVLTLLIIPTLYDLIDRLSGRFAGARTEERVEGYGPIGTADPATT
ncbi:MAG: efflux RND transporter permease subunit [Acidobacteriota bacterium]